MKSLVYSAVLMAVIAVCFAATIKQGAPEDLALAEHRHYGGYGGGYGGYGGYGGGYGGYGGYGGGYGGYGGGYGGYGGYGWGR